MEINDIKTSVDGTQKYQFNADDGGSIEACTLLMAGRKHSDFMICVSSQIGCQFNCQFCISGNRKFGRNLSSAEIVSQVKAIMEENPTIGPRLEITYMGTGEPLANYENVILSIKHFFAKEPAITRVNISTVIPTIDIPLNQFSILKGRGHIQYSIHFTNDNDRQKYMRSQFPSISDSINFLKRLSEHIEDAPCLNYLLFDGINDSKKDAHKLIEFALECKAYLKISTFTPIGNHSMLTPSTHVDTFVGEIASSGIEYKLFKSMGEDIHAACGHFLWDAVF